jgi:hypothetical protein
VLAVSLLADSTAVDLTMLAAGVRRSFDDYRRGRGSPSGRAEAAASARPSGPRVGPGRPTAYPERRPEPVCSLQTPVSGRRGSAAGLGRR